MENPERVTYFAATDARGKRMPFGIKQKDRSRHMYVIGKTGMGKSTLLENLAIQDIRNGEGMAFIDPHGSAVEKLLEYIPPERMNDVVYFAPFDMEHPMAFNVMEDVGYDKRHLVVSGLMATFKKIWEDAWSARMEYILTNTLLALLEYPDATLLGVNRMYTDKGYRKKVVDNIKDPVVKDFWVKEFANFSDTYTKEATPAIQNKIGQFTGNPLIRNIIGQSKSSFDIRTLMDNKKILLINLSKGLVGETNMRLLGSMLTTRIFLGAMSRANLPPAELKQSPNFYFYVDEFQNFANETFADILSEARKYNLNLIVAHQYVEQMEEEVAAAVFGNVGTTIAFRVGPFDAEKLEVVFAPEFTPEDLVNLGFAQIYLSLMIDGIGSRPFSAVTIPPIEAPQRTYKQEVIEASRRTFAAPRAVVEEAINTELAEIHEAPPAEPKPRANQYAKSSGAGERRPDVPPRRPATSSAGPALGPAAGLPQGSLQQGSAAPDRSFASKPSRADSPAISEVRPFRSQSPHAPAKSAEDLRAILRTMTESGRKEVQKKTETKQDSLKGALADVLKKTPPAKSSPLPPAPKAAPQNVRPPETTAKAAGSSTRDVKQEASSTQPRPFEVSEATLREIFKD